MYRGYIKLWRKSTEWGWYTTPHMFHLFQHLIMTANIEDKEWKGQIIKRGQLATGLYSLRKATGISVQSIRTCLKKLKSTHEITIKSTNKLSIITLIKYEDYQPTQKNQQANQQAHQQTTNKQLTTTKEYKNEKNYIYKDGSRFSFKDGTVGILRWGEWCDVKTHAKLGYEYLKELK